MKNFILPAVSSIMLVAAACGPASEDRQNMHARAKVVADSIANMIKVKMAEAESQPPATVTPATVTPADSSRNPVVPH